MCVFFFLFKNVTKKMMIKAHRHLDNEKFKLKEVVSALWWPLVNNVIASSKAFSTELRPSSSYVHSTKEENISLSVFSDTNLKTDKRLSFSEDAVQVPIALRTQSLIKP